MELVKSATVRLRSKWSHLGRTGAPAASLPRGAVQQREPGCGFPWLAHPSSPSESSVSLDGGSSLLLTAIKWEFWMKVLWRGVEVLFPEETCQGGPVWTQAWSHEARRWVRQPLGLGAHLLLKDHPLTISPCPVPSQIALKCADICNPCRIWEMSKQWSERVCEEFYRQG